MIFVSLGSREYQFDRLLIKLDELIEQGKITDTIFAQIGQSTYLPKNYQYERYMAVDEFKAHQKEADLIISHGGTGALVGALKLEKQVIAVPRLAIFGEHTDDHQLQVSHALAEKGYLLCVEDMDTLDMAVNRLKKDPIQKKYNIPSNVVNIIDTFIKTEEKKNK